MPLQKQQHSYRSRSPVVAVQLLDLRVLGDDLFVPNDVRLLGVRIDKVLPHAVIGHWPGRLIASSGSVSALAHDVLMDFSTIENQNATS